MYSPPLYTYVIRHNDSKNDTELLLESIYSTLARDVKNPLARNIGISVFSIIFNNRSSPFQIDFAKAERIIVISFIDDNAVCDDNFIDYLNSIYKSLQSNPKHLFIPIAFSTNAFQIENAFSTINAIRLYEIREDNNYIKLKISLLHEISRHLYGHTRKGLSNEPLNIFISHAKKDGVDLAHKIKHFFDTLTSAKTFFDVNDITPGYGFDTEIIGNIKKSILLVNYTDSYSSREWCRKEMLEGKKARIPILLINSLKEYEARYFPYAGNVPVIKWKDDIDEEIMLCLIAKELMFQTLMFEFSRLNTLYIMGLYDIEVDTCNIISFPPELLSITHLNTNKTIVVYPDPPLSTEELELFENIGANYQFITPIFIPLLKELK